MAKPARLPKSLPVMDYNEEFFASLSPHLPRPTSFPTPDAVRKEASQRSREIFNDWETLHSILERYEAVIRKRWVKKSRDQRKRLLLAAWPNMPATHRPDFKALPRESQQQRRTVTKFKDAFLWPYINLEDLCCSKPLLLFLNSRGRHPPEMFAHADYDAAHVGMTTLAIRSAFLNGYTVYLRGQMTAETYGQLIEWNSDVPGFEDAFDLQHLGIAFHPGHGLQVLETQQKIMRFLVTCSQLILHDIFSQTSPLESSPVQPEPPSLIGDESEWPSLAVIAAEAAYRVPAHLDFRRLQAIVAAKRSAAEDHIRALREDPGYFVETVGDYNDHQTANVLDAHGKPHPELGLPSFWDGVFRTTIIEAYGRFIIWDVAHKQVTKLVTLNRTYGSEVSATKKLPPEFDAALQIFRHFLNKAREGMIETLKWAVPASPPMRSLFVRTHKLSGTTKDKLMMKTPIDRLGKDDLLKSFATLWDEDQLFLIGFPELMDELERVVLIDPKQKQRISSFVANNVSELSVIAELRRQLGLYHPLLSITNENTSDEIRGDYKNLMSEVAKCLDYTSDMAFAAVGTPVEKRFYYPSEKRRTRETTIAMQKAEHELTVFWKAVDDHFRSKAGSSLHQLVKPLLEGDRQIRGTPDWVEPESNLKKVAIDDQVDELYKPFSHLQLIKEVTTGRAVLSEKIIAAKTKTRSAPNATESKTSSDSTDEISEKCGRLQTDDIQPSFIVSKRAFKVFSVLFHNDLEPTSPGEIPWSDFLHAMSQTGFEIEKLYGSIWQFTPTKLDVERSIQFHEPHPASKIPYRVARRHGRRLNRAYGWRGDIFVQGKA